MARPLPAPRTCLSRSWRLDEKSHFNGPGGNLSTRHFFLLYCLCAGSTLETCMRDRSDEGGTGGRVEEPVAREEAPASESRERAEDSMQQDPTGAVGEEEDPTERPIKVRRTDQQSF
jgi:hypothetical protein